MGFIGNDDLAELMRSGRFQSWPTLRVFEIYGGMGYPPEAVLGRNLPDDPAGQPLGECWAADIEQVLAVAEQEGDTDRLNPNLSILRRAFTEMSAMRETREEGLARIEAFEASKIKPFQPRTP